MSGSLYVLTDVYILPRAHACMPTDAVKKVSERVSKLHYILRSTGQSLSPV